MAEEARAEAFPLALLEAEEVEGLDEDRALDFPWEPGLLEGAPEPWGVSEVDLSPPGCSGDCLSDIWPSECGKAAQSTLKSLSEKAQAPGVGKDQNGCCSIHSVGTGHVGL